jgi:transcriptional regulator with XRE-family HTH domain
MPAAAPPIAAPERELLARLGGKLRRAREAQKVSAVAAAEAAGLSRPTLHRIERGEPGVAMGAWVALASTLGLQLDAIGPQAAAATAALPERIRLEAYPQLRQLAWQLPGVEDLSGKEALELYERNWRHVDVGGLTPDERALVRALSQAFGAGRLLV